MTVGGRSQLLTELGLKKGSNKKDRISEDMEEEARGGKAEDITLLKWKTRGNLKKKKKKQQSRGSGGGGKRSFFTAPRRWWKEG